MTHEHPSFSYGNWRASERTVNLRPDANAKHHLMEYFDIYYNYMSRGAVRIRYTCDVMNARPVSRLQYSFAANRSGD